MMQSFQKHSGLLAAASGILMFAWVAILSKTDSYVSVYILCGMAGIFALSENLRTYRNRPPQNAGSGSGISALLSAAAIFANYPLFAPISLLSLFSLCLCFLGGFLVFRNLFLYLSGRAPCPASTPAGRPGLVFLIVFSAISLTDLLYLYTTAYPGVLTRDSVTTIREILQGSYSSTMPFWHTMTVRLFLQIGLSVFGEINRAIAFFHTVQVLFFAACIAYAAVTLYQFGINRTYLLLCCGFYLVMPYHIVYSVTLWKDVPFSASVLLFTAAFSRLLRSSPSHSRGSWVIFVLSGVGVCLWRTNGWYAFLAAALAGILFSKGKQWKTAAVMGGILVVCWILNFPVLTALHVAKADPIEPLAIPLQQIARVIAEGRTLSSAETALLGQFFDLQQVPSLYTPTTVDPIKFEALVPGSRSFLREHLSEFLKTYLSLGRKYPLDYGKAWIEETKGYWNGGYAYWIYGTGISENAFGIAASAAPSVFGKPFRALFRLLENCPLFQPLFSIGLFSWITAGCFALNRRKKRTDALLYLLPLILLLGLCLGSPVFAEFRYAYPVFLTVPFLVGLTFYVPESTGFPVKSP